MKPLKASECIKGTRVLLISKMYEPSPKNPSLGSVHECKGTILFTTSGVVLGIVVEWDNKQRNLYREGDLSLADGEEVGLFIDMWADK